MVRYTSFGVGSIVCRQFAAAADAPSVNWENDEPGGGAAESVWRAGLHAAGCRDSDIPI